MVTESDKDKVLKELHFELHLARKMPNYKATQFEVKVSYLISNLFKDECSECEQVINRKKIEAENQMKGNVPYNNPNLLSKLFGGGK